MIYTLAKIYVLQVYYEIKYCKSYNKYKEESHKDKHNWKMMGKSNLV